MSNLVTIDKDVLKTLHSVAAAGGSVFEKSIGIDTAKLILAQLGIGHKETIAALDATHKVLDIETKLGSPEAKRTEQLILEIDKKLNR